MLLLFLLLPNTAAKAGKASAMRKDKPMDALRERIRESRHPKEAPRFLVPSKKEREVLRRVFAELTAGAGTCAKADIDKAALELKPLSMEILPFEEKSERFLIVRETPPAYRGSGVYVLRCGKARPLVIQTPHSYFDLNTSGLGYKTFRDSRARWLMSNSLHRYRSRKDEKPADREHPADAAHNPNLLFQAATLGALKADPSLIFVQLHGYDSGNHAGDVILSGGSRRRSDDAVRFRDAWKPPAWKVLVYGKDASTLGAATNSQGRAINAADGRFLHIEMSPNVRKTMVTSRKNRTPFVKALLSLHPEKATAGTSRK